MGILLSDQGIKWAWRIGSVPKAHKRERSLQGDSRQRTGVRSAAVVSLCRRLAPVNGGHSVGSAGQSAVAAAVIVPLRNFAYFL